MHTINIFILKILYILCDTIAKKDIYIMVIFMHFSNVGAWNPFLNIFSLMIFNKILIIKHSKRLQKIPLIITNGIITSVLNNIILK